MPKNLIKRKDYEKVLTYLGFSLTRVKGDHFIFNKPEAKRPIVITKDK